MVDQFDLTSPGKAAPGRQKNKAQGDKGREKRKGGTGEKMSRGAKMDTQQAESSMHNVVRATAEGEDTLRGGRAWQA